MWPLLYAIKYSGVRANDLEKGIDLLVGNRRKANEISPIITPDMLAYNYYIWIISSQNHFGDLNGEFRDIVNKPLFTFSETITEGITPRCTVIIGGDQGYLTKGP